MFDKGLDILLDRYAGKQTAQDPTRLWFCSGCRLVTTSQDLSKGLHVRHVVKWTNETWWNFFRWVVGV